MLSIPLHRDLCPCSRSNPIPIRPKNIGQGEEGLAAAAQDHRIDIASCHSAHFALLSRAQVQPIRAKRTPWRSRWDSNVDIK